MFVIKRLFMYSLLGFLSFNAFKSDALTPFEAAYLAQAAEKDADYGDYIEGFQLIAQEIARPNRDAVDQIFAQLWANHDAKEYVVVFNTANGKWELAAVINKVYTYDDVIAFAREQGRIYNVQAKQANYAELAGGYVQKVGAMLVSGVTNATYGLGRGLSYAASGIGSLFFSSKQTAPAEQEENEQNNIKSLPDGYLGNLVEAAHNLYLNLINHADNDEYAIKVVGHCLGGYYAQIIASNNDLGGYSFSSFGMELPQADKSKNFVNYRHINDHLTTLNEQHYGKTIALNDLPLTVIDNLDDHIRTLKIKDSMATRWAIMDESLTKNHAIDGFVDQLNPGNKKSKSVQNSNANVNSNTNIDRSPAPISSPAPKADPIVVQPSVVLVASKPVASPAVSIVPEVKKNIIAPSIVPPAPSFAPPPPPLTAIDGLDGSVAAADGKPITKAQELLAKRKLANEKAAKINEAAAANNSALANKIAERLARVEAEGVKEVSEEQKRKNAKLFQYREVYTSYDKGALEKALLDIADEQEAYKDSLDNDEIKALHDENRIRREAIIAVQAQFRASKK